MDLEGIHETHILIDSGHYKPEALPLFYSSIIQFGKAELDSCALKTNTTLDPRTFKTGTSGARFI